MSKQAPINSAETAPAAEWVETSTLLPWVKNPRKNEAAVKEIAKSIKRFGFASPIIARRENGEVIAGHTRLKAAVYLKMPKVPVRYLDIPEREAHLLALADNKLGEISEWDTDALQGILGDFSLSEAEAAGWGLKELGEMADAIDKQPKGPSMGDGLTYSVVISCADEDEQTELLERFEGEGLKCKPLVT